MAYCYKCGKPLNDGDRFCTHCGTEQGYNMEFHEGDNIRKPIHQRMQNNPVGSMSRQTVVEVTKENDFLRLLRLILKSISLLGIICVCVIGICCAYHYFRSNNLITELNNSPTQDESGHLYVDLGLSVYWSTMNVGATDVRSTGEFYSWSEINTKSDFSFENFENPDEKVEDGWIRLTSIIPSSGRDAARENWGGDWRMPTNNELKELTDRCEWSWINMKGYCGYIVKGPNGNCIFIPQNGYYASDKFNGFGTWYWSSSREKDRSYNIAGVTPKYLECVFYMDDLPWVSSYPTWWGFGVRPVLSKKN